MMKAMKAMKLRRRPSRGKYKKLGSNRRPVGMLVNIFGGMGRKNTKFGSYKKL